MRRLLVPLLLAACVEGEAGGWAGTVETLANGAVRVSNPVQGSWREGAGWRLVPELTLGSVDEGPQAFGFIVDIEVADDGRIFVLDRQSNALHIFDADGTHLRTSGRSGQGPGEFVRANGMAWLPDGDSLLVVDAQGGRYHIFDSDGTYARTVLRSLPGFPLAFEGAIFDDRVYERSSRRRDGAVEFVLIGTALGAGSPLTDTLSFPPQPAALESFRFESNAGIMVMNVPFAPVQAWQAVADGSLWWGHGSDYRILRLSPAGDTLREIVSAAAALPVTAEDIAEWEQQPGTRSFLDMGGRIERDRIPRQKPYFTELYIDPEARLWVDVPTVDGITAFDVFDADGRLLGRLSTGVRRLRWVKPLVRNGRLYVVAADELDVPNVHVLRIAPDPVDAT